MRPTGAGDARGFAARSLVVGLSAALALGLAAAAGFLGAAQPRIPSADTLPSRLGDQEFRQLMTEASEPEGTFPRENLTSNELLFQTVIPELVERTRPGGVYLGVGPEQNFTYIAAVRPAMAVIFDIRRDNLLLQLMYKAIFELSADRAAFVSMLFSKPRPAGIRAGASAAELFAAFGDLPSDEALHQQNLRSIESQLLDEHRLPLSAEDIAGLEATYEAFRFRGFAVRYFPTYVDLMTATDSAGVNRSYLADEETFALLKDLQARNLVVPVVGDFGGPKAIRAVARYLRERGATVSTFYLSNVEQYLYQDGKWQAFCRNVTALPLDRSSTFIRSSSRGRFGFRRGFGGGFASMLGAISEEIESCSS
jgi:hypothetical protein